MQCKNIEERPILEFIKKHGGIGCTRFRVKDCPRSVTHSMPAGVPEKLVLAKLKQLIKRGLVNGCGCGCRGDFEITDKGCEFLTPIIIGEVMH